MAIAWNEEDLRRFFGSTPEPPDDPTMRVVEYAGPTLKYSVFFWPTKQQVWISADQKWPFGRDSLYEVGVRCDRITPYEEPLVYPGEQGLAFWFSEPDCHGNTMTLMMFKRLDGELKVWPTLLAGGPQQP